METAEQLALVHGCRLTAEHWRVLCRVREEWLSGLRANDVATLARGTGHTLAEIEGLFPGDSCALIARLAGIDEPPRGNPS